jgi:hypothetical protein
MPLLRLQVCTCPACTRVPSARTDVDYLSMEALAAAQTTAAEVEWILSSTSGGRRSLKASSTDTMLQSIMGAIGQLEYSQAALQQDVQQLESQVQAANAAEADTALQALISSGQQQILLGQGRIQSLLTGEAHAAWHLHFGQRVEGCTVDNSKHMRRRHY